MLAKFFSHGVQIALSTGRLFHYTEPVAEMLGLPVHYLCADGAHILPNGYQRPIVNSLPSPLVREVMRLLSDHLDAIYLLLTDGIWCSDQKRVNTQILGWGNYLVTHKFGPEEAITALQIVCLIEKDEAKGVFDLLRKTFPDLEIEINRSLDPAYDQIVIRPHGINKGSGLETLAKILKIEIEETLVFGDWINDIPMLLKAGLSVAPTGSATEVKKAADIISEFTNDQDFVGRELQRLLVEKKITA